MEANVTCELSLACVYRVFDAEGNAVAVFRDQQGQPSRTLQIILEVDANPESVAAALQKIAENKNQLKEQIAKSGSATDGADAQAPTAPANPL